MQLVGLGSEGQLSIIILYLRPKSRGSIQIQSNDPLKIVLADEGFLSNPADLEVVKNIYKIYIKNIAQKLTAIDSAYKLMSPTLDIINNDQRLEEFIKQNLPIITINKVHFEWHHEYKVELLMIKEKCNGVSDLIVADDSIVPFTVDGNTSAAAYLIGFTIAQQLQKQG